MLISIIFCLIVSESEAHIIRCWLLIAHPAHVDSTKTAVCGLTWSCQHVIETEQVCVCLLSRNSIWRWFFYRGSSLTFIFIGGLVSSFLSLLLRRCFFFRLFFVAIVFLLLLRWSSGAFLLGGRRWRGFFLGFLLVLTGGLSLELCLSCHPFFSGLVVDTAQIRNLINQLIN